MFNLFIVVKLNNVYCKCSNKNPVIRSESIENNTNINLNLFGTNTL